MHGWNQRLDVPALPSCASCHFRQSQAVRATRGHPSGQHAPRRRWQRHATGPHSPPIRDSRRRCILDDHATPIVTTGENCRRMKRSPGNSSAASPCATARRHSRRLHQFLAVQGDLRDRLRCIGVQVHARAVFNAWRRSSAMDTSMRWVARNVSAGPASCRAPALPRRARKVQRRALAGPLPSRRLRHVLAPATRTRWPLGKTSSCLPCGPCRDQRARHHRAETLHGEHASTGRRTSAPSLGRNFASDLASAVSTRQTCACQRTHCDDRRLRGSRNDPRRNSSTSSRTTSSVSLSTVSDLVSTVMPRRTESSLQMSKCSRVCGLIDSSAAMISSTRSIPPTPAACYAQSVHARDIDEPQPQFLAAGRGQFQVCETNVDVMPAASLRPGDRRRCR